MQTVTLKLKQASIVLGVRPKDLQHLVQLGVIRPVWRDGLCWFDTNLLLKAKVAAELGDISEEGILRTVRESRVRRKKQPEITVVALQGRTYR